MAKKESKLLVDKIVGRLKNNPVVACCIVFGLVVTGIASTSDSLSKIYSLLVAENTGASPVILPKDTGWILGGYFDTALNKYIDGPHFKIKGSPYGDAHLIPRIGDQIKLTSARRIVICDFETKGLTRRYDPPWEQDELSDSDYTGLQVSVGAILEVRDVSLGAFPDHPAAVWIRVGTPQ